MEKLYINFQNRLLSIVILSGSLNGFFNAYVYSFSFTLFIILLVVVDVFCNLITRKKLNISGNYVMMSLLLLSFYILIIFSLFYSPSPKYKYIKTVNFVINCIFFIYPLFIKKLDVDKVLSLVKYVAIGLSLFFIYERYNYWLPSNSINRGVSSDFFIFKPIYLSLGVIVSISLINESLKRNWIQVFALLFLILVLGSRGALLFSIITLFCFNYQKLLNIKIKTKRLSINAIIIILSIMAPLSIAMLKFKSKIAVMYASGMGRFKSLINFAEDKSSLGRLDHYDYAFEMIFNSPIRTLFGYGIGSYGVLRNGLDTRKYPHNIFVESWFETGISGFFILLIIIISVMFFKSNDMRIKAIYFFLFLNAMKTGNLTDLWLPFLFIGLILATHKNDLLVVKNVVST